MTIATEINRNEYLGTGTQDTFAYEFKIWDKTELKVYVDGVLKTVDVHYTVTGIGQPAGGNVVFGASYIPALDSSIILLRQLPYTQGTDLEEGGVLSAETLEARLDKIVVLAQQLKEALARAPKFTESSLFKNLPVPEPVNGGEFIRWKTDKSALELANVTESAMVNPITTKGDLIQGGTGGIPERLPIGTADQVLKAGSSGKGEWADKAPDADKIDGSHASETPAAATIPISKSSGKIDSLWLPRKPLHNLLPNSSLSLCTALPAVYKGNQITVDSYTGNSNTPVCLTANTQLLKTGKLFMFSDGDAALRVCSKLVTGVVPNTSFTLQMEGNSLTPATALVHGFEIVPGDDGTTPTGDGPDWWKKSTSLKYWRDMDTVRDGAMYSAMLKKGGASDEEFYWKVPYTDDLALMALFAGQTVTMGAWVLAQASSLARLKVGSRVSGGDNANFSGYAANGAWTWLETTHTCVSWPLMEHIYSGIYLTGAADAVCYFTQPILVFGTQIGQGNYFQPPGEEVNVYVHSTPVTYNNAAVNSDRWIRLQQETQGQIPANCYGLHMAIEGVSGAAGDTLAISTSDSPPEVTQIIADVPAIGGKGYQAGYTPVNNNGKIYLSRVSAGGFSNVSIDISRVRLAR